LFIRQVIGGNTFGQNRFDIRGRGLVLHRFFIKGRKLVRDCADQTLFDADAVLHVVLLTLRGLACRGQGFFQSRDIVAVARNLPRHPLIVQIHALHLAVHIVFPTAARGHVKGDKARQP
jgi:hypothetical protein